MDDLEALKQQKLEQMRAMQQEQAMVQQQLQQLEEISRAYLTREAFARYSTLKLGHPEKAVRVLAAVAELVKAQKLTPENKLTDEQLKTLLRQMEPPKRESKIRKV